MDGYMSALVRYMRSEIRLEAAKIPDFEEGVIALSLVGKSEWTNESLGDFCDNDDNNVDVDFVFAIRPGGRKTRKAGFRRKTKREMACRGHAVAMIEACAYVVVRGIGRKSSDMPTENNACGRVNKRGAICFDLVAIEGDFRDPETDKLMMRIYVAVAGASGKENEICARAAEKAITKWLVDTDFCTDFYGEGRLVVA